MQVIDGRTCSEPGAGGGQMRGVFGNISSAGYGRATGCRRGGLDVATSAGRAGGGASGPFLMKAQAEITQTLSGPSSEPARWLALGAHGAPTYERPEAHFSRS